MKPGIPSGAKAHAATHAHPTVKSFLVVGAVLAVITAVEFGILYVTGLSSGVAVTILALLSLVKFGLVAGYFMHLRFDSRLLTGVFAVGVILATLITIAVKFINLA